MASDRNAPMRRWEVCIDAEVENEVIEAQTIWYSQDTGWLVFKVESGGPPHAVFGPGKWLYFKEITDEPR